MAPSLHFLFPSFREKKKEEDAATAPRTGPKRVAAFSQRERF
jgi:hypothetical protein